MRNALRRLSAFRLVSAERLRNVRARELAVTDFVHRLAKLEAMLLRVQRDVERMKLHTSVVLQPDRAIALLASGDRIYVDPRDQGCGVNLLTEGKYEEDELRLVRRFLKPGGLFLDIGANYGYYSIRAAPYLRPGGRVLGFEPNPHIHRLFQSSIYLNGFADVVEARCLGVYDSNGVLAFEINEASPGGAHIVAPADRPPPHHLVIDVPTVRLDDHLDAGDIVDVVKIDVEGHEEHVLRGMRAIIARSPGIVIVMECIYALFRDDEAFGQFVGFVRKDLGLHIYRVLVGGDIAPADATSLRHCSCSLVLSRAELSAAPDLTVMPVQLNRSQDAPLMSDVLTWRAPLGGGDAGHLIAHGPYVYLPKGRYRLMLDGDVEGDFLVRLQENYGDLLWQGRIGSFAGTLAEIELPLDAPRFEVAIHSCEDSASLTLRSIQFWPV